MDLDPDQLHPYKPASKKPKSKIGASSAAAEGSVASSPKKSTSLEDIKKKKESFFFFEETSLDQVCGCTYSVSDRGGRDQVFSRTFKEEEEEDYKKGVRASSFKDGSVESSSLGERGCSDFLDSGSPRV